MTSPIPSEPRTGHKLYHGRAITPATAAALTALSIATIYAVQSMLGALGVHALLASAIGDILVLAGLGIGLRGAGVGAVGLTRADARFWIAAGLLGLSVWYSTLRLVDWLAPPDAIDLQGLVEQTPLAITILVLAVLPAITEEIVFRGVLFRSLAARLDPIAAITVSAGVFAAYHLNPPQMISTFALGLALAFLTLRARSIIPAIVVHAINNTVAILISRDEVPPLTHWIGSHPTEMLAGSAFVITCGLALAAKGGAA